ncbi:hypothetical protein M0R45_019193 [Rubus argutus]|uniref:Uncharacterized protein n=1 Tax=Rubus argutus TaxID=59490 RepID=A0AAW1X632_RUBAR
MRIWYGGACFGENMAFGAVGSDGFDCLLSWVVEDGIGVCARLKGQWSRSMVAIGSALGGFVSGGAEMEEKHDAGAQGRGALVMQVSDMDRWRWRRRGWLVNSTVKFLVMGRGHGPVREVSDGEADW